MSMNKKVVIKVAKTIKIPPMVGKKTYSINHISYYCYFNWRCYSNCSNNYGSFHFPEKLIPLFVTNLIEGKKIPVYGSGKNVRDWLHVDDHCRGIYAALTRGKIGQVYNIGGGRELTNIEITHLILNAMGKDESVIEYVTDRKGHDLRYSVDCSKARIELGYKPLVTFEQGLYQTIQWYKENESWWKPLKAR